MLELKKTHIVTNENGYFSFKMTEQDQEIYKDFNLTVSERWQQEIAGMFW